MKKALCTFLSALILISFIAIPCNAEEDTSGIWKNNITWEYDGQSKTLTISGQGKMASSVVTDYPWHKFYSSVETLVVSEGVTSIADYAFAWFSNLKSNQIHLPDSLLSIETGAFSWCRGLEYFTIPKSLNDFDSLQFSGCTSLTAIYVSPDNTYFCAVDGCLYTKDLSELICYPFGKSEKQFAVPYQVKKIRSMAFNENSNIETITMSKVQTIGLYAFFGCRNLEVCSLPESLEIIQECAFQNCSYLKEITIFENVKEIGTGAFDGCTSLEKITFVSPERYIATNGTDILSIDLSDPLVVADYFKTDDNFHFELNIFIIEFYDGEKLIKRINYIKGDNIIPPDVSKRDGYKGSWESYSLSKDSLTKVHAEYTCLHLPEYIVYDSGVVPTDEKDGRAPGEFCTNCGEYISGGETIEREKCIIDFYDGDNLVSRIECHKGDEIIPPDVPEHEGYDGKWSEYTLSEEKHIGVFAEYTCLHWTKYVEDVSQVDPTEENVGYTSGQYCTNCKTYISGHEVIPVIIPTVFSKSNSYLLWIALGIIFAFSLAFAIPPVYNYITFDKKIIQRTVRINASNGKHGTGLIIESKTRSGDHNQTELFIISCKHIFEPITDGERGNICLQGNEEKNYKISDCFDNETSDVVVISVKNEFATEYKNLKRLKFANKKYFEKINTEYEFYSQTSKTGNNANTNRIKVSYTGNGANGDIKCTENTGNLEEGDSGTFIYDRWKGKIIGMFYGYNKETFKFLRSDSFRTFYLGEVNAKRKNQKV